MSLTQPTILDELIQALENQVAFDKEELALADPNAVNTLIMPFSGTPKAENNSDSKQITPSPAVPYKTEKNLPSENTARPADPVQSSTPLPPAPAPEESSDKDYALTRINEASLQQLRHFANTCPCCKQQIPAEETPLGTNPQAKLLIVSEVPWLAEPYYRNIFHGELGELFKKIIASMKLRPEDIYIASAHRCKQAMQKNSLYSQWNIEVLRRQIDLVKPQFILVMSPNGLHYLFDKNYSIKENRGKWLNYKGIPLMTTLPLWFISREKHRERQLKASMWEHIKLLLEKLHTSP